MVSNERLTEVSLQHIPNPREVLLPKWEVEPELLEERIPVGRGVIGSKDGDCRITRKQMYEKKRSDRDAEENGDQCEESPHHKSRHAPPVRIPTRKMIGEKTPLSLSSH